MIEMQESSNKEGLNQYIDDLIELTPFINPEALMNYKALATKVHIAKLRVSMNTPEAANALVFILELLTSAFISTKLICLRVILEQCIEAVSETTKSDYKYILTYNTLKEYESALIGFETRPGSRLVIDSTLVTAVNTLSSDLYVLIYLNPVLFSKSIKSLESNCRNIEAFLKKAQLSTQTTH